MKRREQFVSVHKFLCQPAQHVSGEHASSTSVGGGHDECSRYVDETGHAMNQDLCPVLSADFAILHASKLEEPWTRLAL
jgi:hypothetical protein